MIYYLPLQTGNPVMSRVHSALGDSWVLNAEFTRSCNQLKCFIRDLFWSCSCCVQQAFTQVQSAQQVFTVKQQLFLQLWREMQAHPVRAGTDSTGLSSEEKCSVSSVVGVSSYTHTYTQTKETTTEVYGGSVTLTCQRGKGRGKWCDQLHFESYLQLCTEVNLLSESKRWASK